MFLFKVLVEVKAISSDRVSFLKYDIPIMLLLALCQFSVTLVSNVFYVLLFLLRYVDLSISVLYLAQHLRSMLFFLSVTPI